MTGIQKFFKFFMSSKTFEKVKTESRTWVFNCSCGNEFSIWEAGGLRYKAKGNPKNLVKCPFCLKKSMLTLKKKI